MGKLRLDLDALAVQSFATDEAVRPELGTVRGRQKEGTGKQGTECTAVEACPSASSSKTDESCPTKFCSGLTCQTLHFCSAVIACTLDGPAEA